MGLLDLIFPRQCVACKKLGSYLCNDCVVKIEYLTTQICAYCYKPAISGLTHPRCIKRNGLDGVVSLTNYKTPIRELIKNLKYRLTTDLFNEIATKLKWEREIIFEENATLLPLPLHKSRQNSRGFNQAELLGKLAATKFKLIYRSDLLERVTATNSQVGLTQSDRSENVKDAFLVKAGLKNTKFYIFDDVWTSGATLKEVASVLKKAGAETVLGVTLAHPR